jgi:hypothetical protein
MSLSSSSLLRFLRHPLVLLPCKLFMVIAAYILLGHVVQSWRWAGPSYPLAATVLLSAAVWGAFTLYTRAAEGRAVTEFAARGALREWLAGLAIGILVFAAIIGVLGALGVYRADGAASASSLVAPFCDATLAGVFEETVCRGVLFRVLEQSLGSYWALLISSVLFGAAHLFNPNASLLAAAQVALEAGLLLGAAFMLTRRLWLAIGIHAGWNFAEGGIFGTVESGTSVHGLLHGTLAGPAWLSGGDFGMEASPIALVVGLAAGLAILARAREQHQVRSPAWVRAQPSATDARP